MAEIAAVRGTNGYSVVSTFSGCGGSSLGFEMAGYEIRWASEFISAARTMYRANHPGVPVDERDIHEVDAADILGAIGLGVGELDVFEGSPPCASFSTSGSRAAGWGKAKKYGDGKRQVDDDLFFEFARLVDGLRPRVFVAENVAGLVAGVAKGYMKRIVAALRAPGYRVEARLLDAQWLGVPQRRRRVIIIGVRDDLAAVPSFPRPWGYRYSLNDALGFAVSAACDPRGGFAVQRIDGREPVGTITAEASQWMLSDGQRCASTHDPETGDDLRLSGYAIRSAHRHRIVHADQMRRFTLGQLRRLCGFPDDYVLSGSYSQRWARLGLAVPPVMMRAVAETIRHDILDRCER